MNRPLTVMLVAAEASGDSLGAGLARALKARLGDGVRFVGVGGQKMAEQGVKSPFDIAQLSILGIIEGVRALPMVKRRVRETAALAAAEKPDIAVLIDSWGFTLRVAHALRRLDPSIPLMKYVGPQVWASRPGRAKTLARSVDHLLSIHGFDAPWFEREGLPVTTVGNPTLIRDFSTADPARLRAHIGAARDDQILLVLPGSRPAEIKHVFPPFEDAVRRLKAERPNLKIVLPLAATVAETVKARVAAWPFEAHIIEDPILKDDAFVAATAALACSGTVTTELALAGCPMVVGYRLGPVSYRLVMLVFKSPWVTMFNIAAQDEVAPELLQTDCNGPQLAAAVAARLDDEALRNGQIDAQFEAVRKLGRPEIDPSELAADAVLKLLAERAA
ncbi:lipid-A-disaccharide synthase [Caulobacter sp. SLTY]|uniref:lipid-A-disaccharide synthase n=1 Tax=Caulobacter sp. SLTY TaxID=2683262 RepID=UPI0014134747|nr:lipid-A-disaccharide synthase [Caulobacter sp. SLTY]